MRVYAVGLPGPQSRHTRRIAPPYPANRCVLSPKKIMDRLDSDRSLLWPPPPAGVTSATRTKRNQPEEFFVIVRSSVVAGRARRRPLVPTLGILALSALLLSGCSIGGDAPASPEPSASTEAPTEPAVLIPAAAPRKTCRFLTR